MRGGQLAVLLSLVGLVVSQNADFMPICDSEEFQPPASPIPGLPDQFSFTIEGNLVELNSTAVMTEYYDGPGNRGRLEFGFNGSSGIGIFDYNLGEIFLTPDFRTGEDCRVYPIADNRFINFTFGIENRNGTIHIGSPSTFVEGLRDVAATRYIGEDMIRGIPTQRWQACFNRENISYLIDYYFATEDWNYEGQGQKLDSTQMVPVQFTLNTTRIANGTIRNIYHIYSVIDFRAGPDSVPDSVFQVPNGLACTGRFPGQPVPQIPPFFSTYVQQVATNTPTARVWTYREFYDLPNMLFRIDVYVDAGQGGGPTSISVIHDLSTGVQYLLDRHITNCTTMSLEQLASYFFDIATDDEGTLQLVSPNDFFFLGNEFNYSYEGVSNIRGVDVDSWVSVRDFEKLTGSINLTDAIYEVFFTRPDWIYATDRSINTDPVPWRIVVTGTINFPNVTDNSTTQLNTTFEMDFFDFSTEEPPYDAFDISSCSAPDDFYTMVLIIPGQEKGIDLGQLRRNIRTSVSNYTGLRPLQIGNIQIVSENGSHIFVTFQISNLTSLAKIDPATIVTAQQAVDLITSNTIGSQLPFQIQISPNVSVTPSLRVAGRGPTPTCNGSSCDCTVPLVDPDGSCSTPNCATPPDIPSYFSTTVQQIDQQTQPPSARIFREFYDFNHSLFRFDFYYDGSFIGPAQPLTVIHDVNASVQYVIGNQIRFCVAQPLQESAPYLWDIATDDGGMLQLVSPNNFFFRGSRYNYTYQGASNVRGVDVDSWVSYRSFEQVTSTFNVTNAYYQVFFTRPGWSFSNVQSVTNQPVPWRIVINGTVSTVNETNYNSTVSYFTTFQMNLFDFSTEEPPYDAFDISSCSAPDDYYTVILFIPGNETGIDFGQLKRNIRTSVSKYTGLRPLQIGNIQIIRENGTHFAVTFQLSNITSLAKINPATNVTAKQAVDLITSKTVASNQLPFQLQIYPDVMITPSFIVLGRGRNATRMQQCDDCKTSTQSGGLSTGAVAGIAIALFILGIIIGIILQLVIGAIVRTFRSSGSLKIGDSIKYKRQEDDLKIT